MKTYSPTIRAIGIPCYEKWWHIYPTQKLIILFPYNYCYLTKKRFSITYLKKNHNTVLNADKKKLLILGENTKF